MYCIVSYYIKKKNLGFLHIELKLKDIIVLYCIKKKIKNNLLKIALYCIVLYSKKYEKTMKKIGIQYTTQYKFLNSIVQCIVFVVLCCLVGPEKILQFSSGSVFKLQK